MKKTIYIFLILIPSFGFAQNWALDGTEWYYTKTFMTPDTSYIHLQVVGDTIINNNNCKIIQGESLCNTLSSRQYVLNKQDTLLIYDTLNKNFQVLYNLNLVDGDNWYFYINRENDGALDSIKITIDSIKNVDINTISLKKQYISYTYLYEDGTIQKYTSEVIENIGDITYFFNIPLDPRAGCDLAFSAGIRCFEDSNIGYYAFTDKSCTYEYDWTSIDKVIINELGVRIKQNCITVENSSILNIELFDLNGTPVKYTCNNYLEIADIAHGVYILKITNFDNSIRSIKIKL